MTIDLRDATRPAQALTDVARQVQQLRDTEKGHR